MVCLGGGSVSRVAEVEPWYTGEYIVRLLNGRELTLSRTYRDGFFEALDKT
jgi:DNA-binding LytR/AlgR family response regulator